MKNTEISLWSGIYRSLEPKAVIDRLMANGIHACEFSFEHVRDICDQGPEAMRRNIHEIKAYATDKNFRISQGHMEFHCMLWADGTTDILKRNIDAFQELGVQNMVFHVSGEQKTDPFEPYESSKKRLYATHVEKVQELCDYVKGTDAVLCMENLGSSANTQTAERLLDIIHDCDDSPNLGICLDVGHLHRTNGNGWTNQKFSEFIAGAGTRLRALHVTGNEGTGDQHFFPFTGRGIQPDWQDFIRGLKASPYEGLFNFEVPGEAKNVPLEIVDMKVRYAKELAEYMLSEEFLKA